MTLERELRRALRDLADEAGEAGERPGPAAAVLADTALAGAARRRVRAASATSVALATVAVAVVVFAALPGRSAGPVAQPAASAGPSSALGVDAVADGPVALSAYTVSADTPSGRVAYVRTEGQREFVRTDWAAAAVSPAGRAIAFLGREDPGYLLNLRNPDRQTTHVNLPGPASAPQWSRDGRRVLVTVYAATGQGGHGARTGFAVVDAASGAVRAVDAAGEPAGLSAAEQEFRWAGDGVVATDASHDLRFYDLDGVPTRAIASSGGLATTAADPVSPSGRLAATDTEGRDTVVDLATGAVVTTLPAGLGPCYGWYDDQHLIVATTSAGGTRFAVTSLDGRPGRVLATAPADLAGRFLFSPNAT
ncbi:hypothetical protein F0L68_07600 [Solihabitans fulvus]|uniref:WD40 repeat protein n=1 Tax=Solihabitans fulvus TaxID=1892852 RepID=A0A5B2XP60_9PSEU|nr:hypothetical protein [Solihabitans fulvus]KAA2264915.1 hypothetical protein F0L68_07600 [Solihabitans fulvus]